MPWKQHVINISFSDRQHFSLLQGEEEFRDKLSPIYISLNFSLDPQAPVDQHGLRPILNYQTEQLIEQKVSILSNNTL